MPNVKDFKDYNQLIDIMRNHGLCISDECKAMEFLRSVNYYRFSAYFLTYKKDCRFYDGVTFDNIVELYYFDHELRILLMQYIVRVEILFRNAISHLLAEKYGSLGYIDSNKFYKKYRHDEFMEELKSYLDQSNEIFIKHHRDKYEGKFPVWVAIQTIPLGVLSKLFCNLLPEDKRHITRSYYCMNYGPVESWLKGVADLRNVCAHWGRLYNRPMPGVRLDPKSYPIEIINAGSVFSHMIALFNLLPSPELKKEMRFNFKNLLDKYPIVLVKHLGCNGNWDEFLYA